MIRLRPPFPNWGDHPIYVLLGAVGSLVILVGAVAPLFNRFMVGVNPRFDQRNLTSYALDVNCETPRVDDGKWRWNCYIKNTSPSTIKWKDTFQVDGARLRWICFDQPCEGDRYISLVEGSVSDELSLQGDGTIHFNFLNSGERADFVIACPGEPTLCSVDGRAPNVTIKEAVFQKPSLK